MFYLVRNKDGLYIHNSCWNFRPLNNLSNFKEGNHVRAGNSIVDGGLIRISIGKYNTENYYYEYWMVEGCNPASIETFSTSFARRQATKDAQDARTLIQYSPILKNLSPTTPEQEIAYREKKKKEKEIQNKLRENNYRIINGVSEEEMNKLRRLMRGDTMR